MNLDIEMSHRCMVAFSMAISIEIFSQKKYESHSSRLRHLCISTYYDPAGLPPTRATEAGHGV